MRRPHLTYANVASTLALVIALSGVGYAATSLPAGSVGTKQLKTGAVTSPKVRDRTLRLHDLGGKVNKGTKVLGTTISVPPWGCGGADVNFFNPFPKHFLGSLVVGYITDPSGDAAMDNNGMVVPTVISETTQGGAIANLVICVSSGASVSVPSGSVFHYQIIGP